MSWKNIDNRTSILLGEENCEKLHQKHIVVFGVGGVGGYTVEALARSGIGELSLVDYDIVDPSNLNRQIIALESTLGKRKVEVLGARVADISPACKVHQYPKHLHIDDYQWVIDTFGDADYWLDAVDDVPVKVMLMRASRELEMPFISSMGAGNRIDEEGFQETDISKTHHCPLARSVRKYLREYNIDEGIRVIYNPEPPLTKGNTPVGTISYVPAICGLKLASAAIRDIINKI